MALSLRRPPCLPCCCCHLLHAAAAAAAAAVDAGSGLFADAEEPRALLFVQQQRGFVSRCLCDRSVSHPYRVDSSPSCLSVGAAAAATAAAATAAAPPAAEGQQASNEYWKGRERLCYTSSRADG